ncbi:MAG: serine protease [Kiritimatiellae bacterium]|nr:serine protease [Kiritimatiellia bacterium]
MSNPRQRWKFVKLAAVVTTLNAAGETAAPPTAVSAADAAGRVLVIPIRGPIEPALLYIVRRGAQECAAADDIRAVVFTIDTPGGQLEATERLIRVIRSIKVPRYAWIERQAFSAGALISLAADRIYMAPGSVIGDALPIMVVPLVGPQEMPLDLKEKIVSATAALARATAEQAGHNPAVAEAMVRAEMELKIGDDLVKPAGRLLTLTDQEAARPVGPERKPLLSSGTIPNLEGVLRETGLSGCRIEELRVTSAERIARWIESLGWLFLLIGIGGIYVELRTPGFGLPGTLGLLGLAVFFWGHHVAGLAGYEDLALIVVGTVLLAVEAALPGFGIPGALGSIFLIGGIVLAMTERPPGGWLPTPEMLLRPLGHLAAAALGTAAVGWLAARVLPRTAPYRELVLTASTSRSGGFVSHEPPSGLTGLVGVTMSDLRPAGVALFGERRLDVLADGEFIPVGTPVRIVRVEGFRIIVERDRAAESRLTT